MERSLKDILIERENWNYFDWSQTCARIGLIDGETCFVPYTLAMKKVFTNCNLPLRRVITSGDEVKFSKDLCADKYFLGLVSKENVESTPLALRNSQEFPWGSFMRIVLLSQQYFVVEQEITRWKINNLALTNIKEIFLRSGVESSP
jgi:hypothetical protein